MTQQKTALLTGASGQLGKALVSAVPDAFRLVALGRGECDITSEVSLSKAMQLHSPDVVINAAAYTAVDRAESERDAAFAANATAPEILARQCSEVGSRLLHVSTDFVFDGKSGSPYSTEAPTAPLGVYGASKLAGERAVQSSADDFVIVRTGWVYSQGTGNFLDTMLRLHRERDEIGVVSDQVGTPTSADTLAQALWLLAAQPDLRGTYHFSDAGVCSWYDFAVAIGDEAQALGLISSPARVAPITTQDYPTPAARPAYSVLDKSKIWRDLDIEPLHWRDALRDTLRVLRGSTLRGNALRGNNG